MPRLATVDDAETIGRLMDAFNREYDDFTPGPEALAERIRELLGDPGDTRVLLADDDAGVAVLRLRPALWTRALEAYLAELYVVPERRGQGLGRALLARVLEVAREAGADRIDLGTSETDHAARGLYERMGFTNREGGRPEDPIMYVYEREL